MTKLEACKTFRCWSCPYRDNEECVYLCGEPDSGEECLIDDKKDGG